MRGSRPWLLVLALSGAAACSSTLRAPAPIEAEIAKTAKGRVTVVEFVDFECPFCRASHARLAPLLASNAERVRLVRKQVPLTGLHAHALDAARASVCADAQGRGDQMADLLMHAAPDELDAEGCVALGERAGLDVAKLRACVADAATDARIADDHRIFQAVGGGGVPVLWIGAVRLDGLQDAATYEEALREALER